MQVGWSVAGPGETHGFIPEEIEGTLEKHDQEISSKLDRPDPGAMIARIDRDPGKIPVPVKIGLFAGIPVPVKIVKFTGIPTGILISNF